jgi:hypothetical protein
LSRIRIFALFATLVALATALAACGGGSSDSSGEDPQKVVEGASLEGVKSGELEMSMNVMVEGDEGGDLQLELSGPFEQGAKGELPQLEMTAKADGEVEGEKINFEGGLTLLTDRAFIAYNGDNYEVDPTTFGFLKSSFEQAQQQGGEEADVTACQKAAEGIKFTQFTENLANEGSEDVGGTSTTHVAGELNVSGAVDALIQLTEDPACSSQLEAAGPLPLDELEAAKGELGKAIKKAHVELWVGEDDDIIRKAAVELTVEPPEASGEKVELELELTLNAVNEEQSFNSPSNALPLEKLFKQLGVNPLELLESGGEGGLGGLLEGITGSEGTSSEGGSSEGSSEGASGVELEKAQKEYVECLKGAQTAQDLQECASLLE